MTRTARLRHVGRHTLAVAFETAGDVRSGPGRALGDRLDHGQVRGRCVPTAEHIHQSPQVVRALPGRRFDLRDRRQRARLYELVLREGRPSDVLAYVDGALVMDACWVASRELLQAADAGGDGIAYPGR